MNDHAHDQDDYTHHGVGRRVKFKVAGLVPVVVSMDISPRLVDEKAIYDWLEENSPFIDGKPFAILEIQRFPGEDGYKPPRDPFTRR